MPNTIKTLEEKIAELESLRAENSVEMFSGRPFFQRIAAAETAQAEESK